MNHGFIWSQYALLQWADSYRAVTVPAWDALDTLPFFITVVLRQLQYFSVPAFLFISGFFAAYAARGSQGKVTWQTVTTRVQGLLIPYFIWSAFIFLAYAIQGTIYTPWGYLYRIAVEGALGPYFFVPLLCTFYLLSPWIVSLAKKRWKLLLFTAAAIQIGLVYFDYLRLFWGYSLHGVYYITSIPDGLIFRWAFWFPLGVVCGLRIEPLKQFLARFKRPLWIVLPIVAALNVIESYLIIRYTKDHWYPTIHTITFFIYTIVVILCFLSLWNVRLPLSSVFRTLAGMSFGIYFLHYWLIEFFAQLIRFLAPQFLAYQLVYGLVVLILGFGCSLLIMTAVARSPARKYYRYLFG